MMPGYRVFPATDCKKGECPICGQILECGYEEECDDDDDGHVVTIQRIVHCPRCDFDGYQYSKLVFDGYETRE